MEIIPHIALVKEKPVHPHISVGNHWVLVDQACLLNEVCRTVSYIKLSLLKSTMLSISHTAKIVK